MQLAFLTQKWKMGYKKKPLRQRLRESVNSLNFGMPRGKSKRDVQVMILKDLFNQDDHEEIC